MFAQRGLYTDEWKQTIRGKDYVQGQRAGEEQLEVKRLDARPQWKKLMFSASFTNIAQTENESVFVHRLLIVEGSLSRDWRDFSYFPGSFCVSLNLCSLNF